MSRDNQHHHERGMITAELALGTLAVTVMAVVMMWLGGILLVQQQTSDSAAQIARQAARGDNASVQKAIDDAPHGSTVDIRRVGADIVVDVRRNPPTPVPWLTTPLITAEARVQAEPGVS